MNMGFQRLVLLVSSSLALVACGQNQVLSSPLQKTSESCAGSALPQQFIIKNLDGSIEVVRAESEQALLDGYVKANAGKIQYAEHDYVVHTALPVQQQLAGSVPTIADNWGAIKIEADKLWAQNVRGDKVVVAIVDSGMDLTHPQLHDQVFVNPGEYGPDARGGRKENNMVDDDGNGYVDDYLGYDFVLNAPLQGDHQHHGTHVSGIVAAYHQDTTAKAEPYVQGIAPNAKLLPLAFLDDQGSGSMSDGVRAIQYAVSRGARVINASWGGTQCSQTLKDVISSLADKNIVFVAAAGNDSWNVDTSPEYPASLNLAAQITVGATGDHDYMAQYSNYGARAVHIFAPGTNIVSTLPGGQMGFLSGTSMATPFVSGAMALLISAIPDATVAQLRSAIYNSALHNAEYINASQGRLDMAQALVELHKIVGH